MSRLINQLDLTFQFDAESSISPRGVSLLAYTSKSSRFGEILRKFQKACVPGHRPEHAVFWDTRGCSGTLLFQNTTVF